MLGSFSTRSRTAWRLGQALPGSWWDWRTPIPSRSFLGRTAVKGSSRSHKGQREAFGAWIPSPIFWNRKPWDGKDIGPIQTHLSSVRIQLEVAYTMSMKALVALLLFPVAFLTLSAQQGTSDTGQNASPTNSDQQLQEPPVDVAPEPTDPVE